MENKNLENNCESKPYKAPYERRPENEDQCNLRCVEFFHETCKFYRVCRPDRIINIRGLSGCPILAEKIIERDCNPFPDCVFKYRDRRQIVNKTFVKNISGEFKHGIRAVSPPAVNPNDEMENLIWYYSKEFKETLDEN